MNNKTKTIFITSLSIITLQLLSLPVAAEVGDRCRTFTGRRGFPMICRGPIKIEVGGYGGASRYFPGGFHDVLFQFEPSLYAAGEDGALLEPGTCSWTNRAPRGDELSTNRAFIRFNFQPPVKKFTHTVVMNAITSCNLSDACRIKVCAARGGNGYDWGEYVDIIPSQQ